MTPALLLAMGLGLGAHPIGLALAAGAVYFPLPTAIFVSFFLWRSRPAPPAQSAAFCAAVAGELRAGDSLRNALQSAARSLQSDRLAELCRFGAPFGAIADEAGRQFEDIGVELRTLLASAASSGPPDARLFDETAEVALAQAMVAREVASAAAPARATAVVFLAALAWGVGLAFGGEAGPAAYVDLPAQRIAVLAGFGLVVTGFTVSGWMLMRQR